MNKLKIPPPLSNSFMKKAAQKLLTLSFIRWCIECSPSMLNWQVLFTKELISIWTKTL